MYKKIVAVLFVLTLCVGVNAQEGNSGTIGKLDFGASLIFSPNLSTTAGSFEFGFQIIKKPTWDIRNQILINGRSLSDGDDSELTLADKLSFGDTVRNGLFRYYSFLEVGVGFYANASKKLFETPITFNFGLGVGLDVFVVENFSFFGEFSAVERVYDETWILDPRITTGCRYYFK